MKNIFKDLDLSDEVVQTLTERIESAKKEWQDGAKNDPDFVNQIRSEESGKFFNSIEKVLKRNLGVTPEDLDQDLTGLKRQEALLKLGLQSLEQNKDKTNRELQDELLAAKAAYKELEEEKVPQMLEKERQIHYRQYVNKGIMRDTMDFETTCNEKARVSIVQSYLQDNNLRAEWIPDEQAYRILTKENLKYTKDDRPLTNREIVELALDDGGVLKKSNGAPQQATNVAATVRNKGKLSSNAESMLASFNR